MMSNYYILIYMNSCNSKTIISFTYNKGLIVFYNIYFNIYYICSLYLIGNSLNSLKVKNKSFSYKFIAKIFGL